MAHKAKQLPTQEVLKEWFNYNEITGELTWKKSPAKRIKVGALAGSIDKRGYAYVRLKGVKYLVHRLAYKYVYGIDPIGFEVDHANSQPSDNSIKNLRLATHSQNMANRQGLNVSWCAVMSQWRVAVQKDRKSIHGGYFFCFEKAKAAAAALKQSLFGEFRYA